MTRAAQDQHDDSAATGRLRRPERPACKPSLTRRAHPACAEILPAAEPMSSCGSINQHGMTGTGQGFLDPVTVTAHDLNIAEYF